MGVGVHVGRRSNPLLVEGRQKGVSRPVVASGSIAVGRYVRTQQLFGLVSSVADQTSDSAVHSSSARFVRKVNHDDARYG